MLLGLALVVLAFAAVYGILCLATYDKDLLPEYIKLTNHTDWPWPFSLIPRRWTSWVLMMPPAKVCGTQEPRLMAVEPNYPLDPAVPPNAMMLMAMDPVPPIGQWSVQSVKLFRWLPRIPCYATGAWMVAGRRLYFNAGLKPDMTWDGQTRNFHWGFPEASLTWTRTS